MTKEELQLKIQRIFEENWSLQIYFILKNEESLTIKKADIDNGQTTQDLKQMFLEYLTNTLLDNQEMSVCSLSTADERTNSIYEYDYNEYPNEINFIKNFDIHSAIQNESFSFANDDLKNLYGYIIYIGTMENGFSLFKKHYPIALIKRDAFLLRKCDQRFIRLEGDDIIRLNDSVQLFKLENSIFVIDIKVLERNFGFDKLIQKRAEDAIGAIDTKGLLEDIQVLKDSAEDLSYARKLSKVKDCSPIIQLNIPNDQIILFTQNNPGLRGKFKYNEDGSKIRLDTKHSKNAFIKLLNDNFLKSELTELYYDSLAKDNISL